MWTLPSFSTDLVQVDRILAFGALAKYDVEAIFELLLQTENKQRRKRAFQLSLPRHERLLLSWDKLVTKHLSESELLGGYVSGYAKQGASKCNEAVGQLLSSLSTVDCMGEQFQYRLGVRSNKIQVECVPPAHLQLPARSMEEL